jgi:hypothetical protein
VSASQPTVEADESEGCQIWVCRKNVAFDSESCSTLSTTYGCTSSERTVMCSRTLLLVRLRRIVA